MRASGVYRLTFADDVFATLSPVRVRGRCVVNVQSNWERSGVVLAQRVGGGSPVRIRRGGWLCDSPGDADFCINSPGGCTLTITIALLLRRSSFPGWLRFGRSVSQRSAESARVDVYVYGECEVQPLPDGLSVRERTRGFPVIIDPSTTTPN